MFDSITKLIIGDLEEKRTYRKFKKRVNALPKDYRFAFRKIWHFMLCFGLPDGDMSILTDLADLFEESAAEGKRVLDVTGNDLGTFCNELLLASRANTETAGEKLNKEILERFHKEDNNDA